VGSFMFARGSFQLGNPCSCFLKSLNTKWWQNDAWIIDKVKTASLPSFWQPDNYIFA
jgi:hypothetical protein